MKRYLVALGAASLVGTVVLGSAAALNVDGGVAQAGLDNDLTCQPDDQAVSVVQWHEFDHTLKPVSVGAAVSNIAEPCEGEWVIVTAFDSSNTMLGQFTAVVPDGGDLKAHWTAGSSSSDPHITIPIENIYKLTVGLVS